jgi:hypothetical protein
LLILQIVTLPLGNFAPYLRLNAATGQGTLPVVYAEAATIKFNFEWGGASATCFALLSHPVCALKQFTWRHRPHSSACYAYDLHEIV